mgnify:CR=1 FL=1
MSSKSRFVGENFFFFFSFYVRMEFESNKMRNEKRGQKSPINTIIQIE